MNKYSSTFRFLIIFMIAVFSFTLVQAADGPKWIGAFFVKGKVGLKWKAIDGAEEYKIYRKTSGEEFQLLISLTKTHHFDTEVSPGATYIYKVAAVIEGSEAESTAKTITIPGSSGEFAPPEWSGLRVDGNKIFLKFDKVPGAMAYNVYRAIASGGEFDLIGNSQSNRFADVDGLIRGETYYYVVTALNEEFEETEYSEEMSIKFGMNAEEIEAVEAENQVVLEDIKLTFLFDITTAGDNDDMNQPADVFVNSKGNIYIADALKQRVNCYDNSGGFLFSFGEKTSSDMADDPPEGSFSYPFTLFIDKQDRVYVSDVQNNDIQVFSEEGTFIKRIRVATNEDQEKFRPNGLHVLDDGRIVTTDAGNHRFMIIDQSGKILFEKGNRGSDEGEQFIFPDGLTVTSKGLICIVDVINSRIQEFDLDGNFIRAFGEPGQSAGTFGRPKAITEGDNGRLWVSDGMGNTVQIFTPEGEVKSAIVTFDNEDLKLISPRGIFVKDGRFYVINRLPHRLMVFKIG